MVDDPLTACEECEAPVERVFHPIAIHFKGKGFYNTDYGRKKKGGAATSSETSGDSGGGSTSTEPKSEAKAESKPESKSESKSD